jgi:hypothetical protein
MAETPFRKGSVTQTGTEATGLSSPDLRAASFSREGVVDRGGLFRGAATARGLEGIAGGIRDFGQIALDVDEGIAKAQLEKDLLDEVGSFDESRAPDFADQQKQRLEDATLDATALEAKSNILRGELGEGAAIAATEPEFASITSRLKNARRAGAISIEEFQLRTKEALRRAVTRRPGLLNELTQHAATTLGLSGVFERQKLEESLARKQKEGKDGRRDRAIKQLDKANMAFDFDAPTEDLEVMLNRRRRQEEAFQEGQRIREITQVTSQEQGLSILRQEGSNFGAGAYNDISQKMLEAFESQPNLSSSKAAVNALVASSREKFNSMGRDLLITNTPEFKDARENWMGAIENLAKILEDAESGEEAARLARVHMTIIDSQNKRELYDAGVNPDLTRAASHIAPFVQSVGLLNRDPRLQKPITQIYESLMLQMTNSPSLDRSLETRVDGKTSDLALILGSAAKTSLPVDMNKPGNRRPDDLEKMVETAMEVIDRNIGRNQTAAFKAMSDTIKEYANPEMRDRLANATPATKAMLVDLGIKQASALEPDRNRFLSNAAEQGVVIRPRVLPNGTLQFFTDGDTENDRKLLRQFNGKFANKYNDLIRFKSTLFGMSVPETSSLLGEIYSGGSVQQIRDAIDTRRKVIDSQRNTQSSIDNSFIDRVIEVESGGNPNAQARTSSALGVGQFTKGTWLATVRRHSPELLQGRSEEQVLELRKNPDISRNMIAALAADNASSLERNGLSTTPENLYLAHFLGVGGATNLLSSPPDTPTEDVLGNAQIRANKSVLEGKSVQDVIEWAKGKMGEG